MRKIQETIFSVVFKKGQASRNRLPLSHVLATLREVDTMIREVGRRVQRGAGVEKPDGDFGIELLAGASGIAFQKGSVKAAAAMTRDVANGRDTVARVIETTNIVERRRVVSIDEYRAPVLRGLANISNSQLQDKTELRLLLCERGKVTERSTFSERGARAIQKMGGAEFALESVTLFGKLRTLTDRSIGEKEDDIWGMLVEDNGNKWRIKFNPADITKAQGLFTRQVVVSGNVTYFKTQIPRVDVKAIAEDKERDYVAGAALFSKEYEGIFGDRDPGEIIRDMRG